MGDPAVTDETDQLDAVFGKDSIGDTPDQRAKTSKARFIRSQHQISQYRDTAPGRVLSATEALRLFGWERLKELVDRAATPIIQDSTEPFLSIQRQLDQIGLSLEEVARKIRWPTSSVERFRLRKQIPFRDLVRIAQAIDLDENLLGAVPDAGADRDLSVRLRTLKARDPLRFTPTTVLGLVEAAWTVRRQYELASLVGEPDKDSIRELGFIPSDDYGSRWAPDYQKGYDLALKARELLNIGLTEPISSLKELIEGYLRVPVIQLEMNPEFAGATVASGDCRGIVVNLSGSNQNALVRRMTMAHELGHLLWDSDHSLKKLVVDRYDQIDRDFIKDYNEIDHVERRANAFAIEFLAPGATIIEKFKETGGGAAGLENLMINFGVSKTALVRHLANRSHNLLDASNERLPEISVADWEGRESLAVPLFAPQDIPVSRRGRFAFYILRAFEDKLISDDTAATLYGCGIDKLDDAIKSTRNYVV